MTDGENKDFKVVTTEPVAFDVGQVLHVASVDFASSDAIQSPTAVKNWEFFEGALVAVVIGTGAHREVLGTACIIAPGLAVTAAHVFADVVEQAPRSQAGISCIGITSGLGEHWRASELNFAPGEEVAFLSIERCSAFDMNQALRVFRLTTRTPKVGELVTMVGFQFPDASNNDEGAFLMAGQMLIANGPVTRVFPRGRDSVLMPFPAIEVDCGSAGGMSGGAVLDAKGFLLGVTSKGLETTDKLGPSYAAWLIAGFHRRVTITWPKGVYSPHCHVLDIDPRLLHVQGREHIKIKDDNHSSFKVWFDPSEWNR